VLKKLISAFALALACVCLLQTPEAEAGGQGVSKQTKNQKVYLKNTCYSELTVGVNTSSAQPPTAALTGDLGTLVVSIAGNRVFYVKAVPSGSPPGTPMCVNQTYSGPSDHTPIYILIDCVNGARVVSQKEWNAATPCT
jgi:hypothetical protein